MNTLCMHTRPFGKLMSSDLLDRSLWTAQNLCLGDLSTSPHEPVHDYCLGDSSENMIYVCLGPHVRMPRYMRIVFRSLLSVDRGGLSRDNTGVTSITRRLVAPPTGAYETPVCLEVGLTYDLTAILVTPPPISTMVISSSPSQTGLPIRGHKAGGTFSVLGSENMFWQRLEVVCVPACWSSTGVSKQGSSRLVHGQSTNCQSLQQGLTALYCCCVANIVRSPVSLPCLTAVILCGTPVNSRLLLADKR